MKFKTFRAVVLGGGALVLFGGVYGAYQWKAARHSEAGESLRPESPPAANNGTAALRSRSERPSVRMLRESPPASPVASSRPPASAAADPSADIQTAATAGGLRAMDKTILERAESGISGSKLKDAIRGHAWKVNLYKDDGQARVNRVKIDLDRDNQWDEKWTLEENGQKVRRQVSPSDDGNYTQEFRLRDGRWVEK